MMDAELSPDQAAAAHAHAAAQHAHAAMHAHAAHAHAGHAAAAGTALTKQLEVQHLCDHRCHVQHMFGNAFRCSTSGQLHVCDANCGQRVYNDRYSTICRISRKVFPNAWVAPAPCRKRSSNAAAEESPPDACRKRGPGAPAACPDAPGFFAPGGASQEDAMVM